MGKSYSQDFLNQQKKRLLSLKESILNGMNEKSDEDIRIPSDQIIEDGDQAQTYINQNVSLELRDRDLVRLKEIEYALHKLATGSYGICEETDLPIGKKRLEKMPWAQLSIEAAEDEERISTYFRTG